MGKRKELEYLLVPLYTGKLVSTYRKTGLRANLGSCRWLLQQRSRNLSSGSSVEPEFDHDWQNLSSGRDWRWRNLSSDHDWQNLSSGRDWRAGGT